MKRIASRVFATKSAKLGLGVAIIGLGLGLNAGASHAGPCPGNVVASQNVVPSTNPPGESASVCVDPSFGAGTLTVVVGNAAGVMTSGPYGVNTIGYINTPVQNVNVGSTGVSASALPQLAPAPGPTGSVGTGITVPAVTAYANGTPVGPIGNGTYGASVNPGGLPAPVLPSSGGTTCLPGNICVSGKLGTTAGGATVYYQTPAGTTPVPVPVPAVCVINFNGPCPLPSP